LSSLESHWLRIGDAARDIWERYVSAGYQVLPGAVGREWLGDYEPDLIARRGDEWVVIEVKRAEELVGSSDLASVAERVAAQPGWNFELFVVGSGERPPADSHEPLLGVDSVEQLLASAEALATPSALHLKAVVVAAALEAAARALIAEVEPRGVAQSLTSAGLMKALLAHGFIEEPEHEQLLRFLAYRDRVAHGYGVELPSQRAFSDLTDLPMSVTRRALDEIRREPAQPVGEG
jgi:hypothetical protein